MDKLADFKPTISAQLFAHHHTDSVKIFQSKPHGLLGWQLPISAAFLVPGVSPMRFVVKIEIITINVNCFLFSIFRSTLATETGANNPGLRLYKYDTEAGEVNGQWPCV